MPIAQGRSSTAFDAKVGQHLVQLVAVGAVILVLGVAFSRPLLLGPNAHALACGAAVLGLGLSLGGHLRAYRQLHPSLAGERAALAQFVPPPGAVTQYTTIDVTATPDINRSWTVPGTGTAVCAATAAALGAWVDPGTLRPAPSPPSPPSAGCRFAARRGDDDVMVDSFPVFHQDRAVVELVITRTR